MQVQLNIFGEEVPLSEIKLKEEKVHIENFRQKHGYNKRSKCRDCKYLVAYQSAVRMYEKCQKQGITAKDISSSDYACRLFEEKERLNDNRV